MALNKYCTSVLATVFCISILTPDRARAQAQKVGDGVAIISFDAVFSSRYIYFDAVEEGEDIYLIRTAKIGQIDSLIGTLSKKAYKGKNEMIDSLRTYFEI